MKVSMLPTALLALVMAQGCSVTRIEVQPDPLFAPVDLGPWGPYFTTATNWYAGQPFDVVQLMYPDRNGFMPYETGYEQRMTLAQPVIGSIA